jgi:magnesium transporter
VGFAGWLQEGEGEVRVFSQPESMRDNLLPGSLVFSGEQKMQRPRLRVFDYTRSELKEVEAANFDEVIPYTQKEDSVTWINIDGLHDVELIRQIQGQFHIHPLVLEDVLNPGTRPKFEAYEHYAFIVLKSIRFDQEAENIVLEQMSFIFGAGYVVSFQERPGTFFDSVRDRLRNSKGRIRNRGAAYLCYALVDALVDDYYKLPEALNAAIEAIEARVLANPNPKDLEAIYNLKRELVILDRALWPVQELVGGMRKDDSGLMADNLGPYLQDLSDHVQHLISSMQAIREMTSNLQDLYLTMVSNSMNQVMKVLAIIATIFIPLTFIAGVFGMNFEFMPELKIRFAYPITLVIMGGVAVLMTYYFKRKKWL